MGAELDLDLLLVEPPAYYADRKIPMVGRALRLPWWNVATWLSRPMLATSKHEHGAWTPALFRSDRKTKANLVYASALLVDVDEGGDVHRIAELLTGHLAAVHSTFSSTRAQPRGRIVLPFAEPVDGSTYEATFRVVAGHLLAAGVGVDVGTKDAGRLGFLPCVKPGGVFDFAKVDGEPLDARAVLAAQPPPPPRSARRLVAPEHHNRYVRRALERGADAVAGASDGDRHATLNREAHSLARLDIGDDEIAAALLPAFVAAAGERRARG